MGDGFMNRMFECGSVKAGARESTKKVVSENADAGRGTVAIAGGHLKVGAIVAGCVACIAVVVALCCALGVSGGNVENANGGGQDGEYAPDSVYNSPKSSTADLHKLAAE